MLKLQDVVQDELRKMDLLQEQASALRTFDVSEQIMNRVYRNAGRNPERPSNSRLRRRVAVPALTLLSVLVVSVTGYAGAQYLEFRNGKGEVVMNTGKAGSTSPEYTQTLNEYAEQVQARLQPGEYAAYYVKDELIAELDKSNPVKFAYKEKQWSSFEGLQQEIARTQAPSLRPVSSLPGGYGFDYGYVYPADKYPTLLQDPDYRALNDELVRQSESAPSDERVFSRTVAWDKADFTLARYSNGEDQVTITVRETHPDTTLTTVIQNDSDSAEKLSIGGKEVYYIKLGDISRQEFSSKQRLGWMDETTHLYYEIYDSAGSALTKEDLVKLAANILEG